MSPESVFPIGGKNYQDDNSAVAAYGVAKDTVHWRTDFNQDSHGNINVWGISAEGTTAYGIGAICNYNGDGRIISNYGPNSHTEASFTVGVSINSVNDTKTWQMDTIFHGTIYPYERDYTPAL